MPTANSSIRKSLIFLWIQLSMAPAEIQHGLQTHSLVYVRGAGAIRKFPSVSLIHHQGIICCVAFGRSSLRRIIYTTQSSLLGALHLTPCW